MGIELIARGTDRDHTMTVQETVVNSCTVKCGAVPKVKHYVRLRQALLKQLNAVVVTKVDRGTQLIRVTKMPVPGTHVAHGVPDLRVGTIRQLYFENGCPQI